jgi:hypothetical protein
MTGVSIRHIGCAADRGLRAFALPESFADILWFDFRGETADSIAANPNALSGVQAVQRFAEPPEPKPVFHHVEHAQVPVTKVML